MSPRAKGDGSGFTGIPTAALDFYEDLQADPTKSFWTAHRQTYEDAVRLPLTALTRELAPEFGEGKLFRPYRDVRFSKDKTPYKDHQGATCGEHYVQLDAAGLLVAGGWYSSASDQVERFRNAVADDATGALLVGIIADLEAGGYTLTGEQLKTRPRGYDADHPRIDLLRHKSLYAWRRFDSPAWLATPKTRDVVAAAWRSYAPLLGWLADHVGPSSAAR